MSQQLTGFTQLRNAIKRTFFKLNPTEKEGDGHPHLVPEHYAPAANNIDAALILHEDVKAINEQDYGDFMRKANAAILQFQDSLYKPSREISEMLIQVKTYLQFSPSWHVESTQKKLLEDIEILISLMVVQKRKQSPTGVYHEYNM